MKRIVIDDSLCMGSRECTSIATDAIEFDKDGIARASADVTVDDDVAEHLASSCPGMAIEVIDI